MNTRKQLEYTRINRLVTKLTVYFAQNYAGLTVVQLKQRFPRSSKKHIYAALNELKTENIIYEQGGYYLAKFDEQLLNTAKELEHKDAIEASYIIKQSGASNLQTLLHLSAIYSW